MSAKTIIILRHTMHRAEYDFEEFVSKIPKEQVQSRKSNSLSLNDGTRIIAMSDLQFDQGGARGISNVEYR